MDPKFKKIVMWFIFLVFAAILVLGFIIPSIIYIYSLIFFKDFDVKGLTKWINTSSILISFFSALLGAISIYLAIQSNNETKNIFSEIREIKVCQEDLKSFFNTNFTLKLLESSKVKWFTDDNKE